MRHAECMNTGPVSLAVIIAVNPIQNLLCEGTQLHWARQEAMKKTLFKVLIYPLFGLNILASLCVAVTIGT